MPVRARRHDQELGRGEILVGPDDAQQLETRHGLHVPVRDHNVVGLSAHHEQRLVAILRRVDGAEAEPLPDGADDLPDDDLIICDEQPLAGERSRLARPSHGAFIPLLAPE